MNRSNKRDLERTRNVPLQSCRVVARATLEARRQLVALGARPPLKFSQTDDARASHLTSNNHRK